MSFMNLKGGDRVRFYQYAGRTLGGEANYRKRVAKVQPLLVFEDHVVVNLGGPHGKPAVVNAENFIEKVGS
jgi:hypothetical protein